MENELMRKIRLSKEQSINTKNKNVEKHLRIANNTSGHEKEVHLNKANKLQSKYN